LAQRVDFVEGNPKIYGVSATTPAPYSADLSDWSLGQNSFLLLAQRVDFVEYNPKIYASF
jgi:hypothetical protein